jgi:hypothetical protein
MKKFFMSFAIAFVGVLIFFGGDGAATLIPPPGFDPDDGTELFIPSDGVLNAEIWDLGAFLVTFGFFYGTEPGTLIPIFGPEDETTIGDPQRALIDFDRGVVWDIDDAERQSSFFTDLGTDIGFYLALGSTTLYTVPSLNPGGVDLAATFPSLTNPDTYVIGFESESGIPLAYELVSGITPIPEPATLLLLGSGLAGVAMYRRKNKNKK